MLEQIFCPRFRAKNPPVIQKTKKAKKKKCYDLCRSSTLTRKKNQRVGHFMCAQNNVLWEATRMAFQSGTDERRFFPVRLPLCRNGAAAYMLWSSK